MKRKHVNYFLYISIIIFSLSLFINYKNKKLIFNAKDEMIVHFIDVGQGDCILVQVNDYNMLIDSGPFEANRKVKEYLEGLNINTIDYLIATHPHEDHIGNMSYIINNYNVLSFYSPKVITNSSSFEKLIDALNINKLKANVIKANMNSINLGENTKVEFFSPNLDYYENLNNYSPIMKITYKNTSFLFTGDAEELIENEVISNNYNLKSDILKVGHHGSSTSTSKDFYENVNPSISVITVGVNSYGHPTSKTLNKIKSSKIHRTDKDGDIVIISDGNSFK